MKKTTKRATNDMLPEEDAPGQINVAAEHDVKRLRDAFLSIERTINRHCIQQSDMIRGLLLSVIAREHIILVGPHGCNKTRAINALLRSLNVAAGESFFATLDKFTAPDAILGMFSPKQLKENDSWVRNTTNKMPEATFAFIGEVFRGNSAVRASLHTIMNERYFENDGQRVECPLHTCFCDSNSYPHREEDFPFYDRILLRFHAGYIASADKKNFVEMLALEDSLHTVQPLLTIEDVQAANDIINQIDVPGSILEMLHEIRAHLLTKNIQLSDRRWHRSLSILRASAFLRGASIVDAPDLAVLSYIAWDTPEQREELATTLAAYTAKSVNENDSELTANAEKIFAEAMSNSNENLLGDALVTLAELGERAVSEKARKKISDMVTKVEQKLMDA